MASTLSPIWIHVVTLIMTATTCATAQDASSASHAKVLSAESGRYVFGQISEYRKDQFMLDTHNGRLWRTVLLTSDDNPDGVLVLELVPYHRGNEFIAFPDQKPAAPRTKP